MATKSAIEWTKTTWNPVTGCDKISPGCKHCYAERMAKRLQAMRQPRYRNGFTVTLQDDLVSLPLRWKKPRLVFVNSMSDLFHQNVPNEFIAACFDAMSRLLMTTDDRNSSNVVGAYFLVRYRLLLFSLSTNLRNGSNLFINSPKSPETFAAATTPSKSSRTHQ